jgi:lycopene beta-cyclase
VDELLLVGGGLANGLIAWRIRQLKPQARLTVLEAGPALGGNHTWSFHGSDVSVQQLEWLRPLISRSWEGHTVEFPGRTRTLGGGYHSIQSSDFHARIHAKLGEAVRLGAKVRAVEPTAVVLESGERLEAQAVLDGRGFLAPPTGNVGYQKFLGCDLQLTQPHGLTQPLLMDATVPQLGGFRFLYSLPWTETRVLVEDTTYSNDAALDLPALRERIRAYADSRGWKIAHIEREEAAALPIPLDGEVPRPAVATTGVAAGLFNATTGYSLPLAVELADALAGMDSYQPDALRSFLQARASAHWASDSFFRLLNRMLFKGATPAQRVKIFESFYGHGEPVIERFYAGKLTALDKFKVLVRGAPTVPAPAAVRAAWF